MQKFAALSALALVALGVSAQSSVCPTVTVATVTGTVTETYCPGCGLTTPAPMPTLGGTTIINNNDVEINIYVFPAIGSNGWYESTYTVTEECPCTANKGGNYIPQGFTTSVTTCTVGGAVTTATVTCPTAAASTTWTTVWESPCSTGLAPVTYTITEECPCTASHAADYVPSGFTTSAYTCTACATASVVTVTVPAASGAASGSKGSTGSSTTAIAGPPVVQNGGNGTTTVSTAKVGTSATASTTVATWTGSAATHTSNMGIALFTVAGLTLAAAIGF